MSGASSGSVSPPRAEHPNMGSELEDALRAAAKAAAAAKATTMTSSSSAMADAGASSPPRPAKRRKSNKRLRRRSRSESMASDSGAAGDATVDAVQRIEAFKERMFDVGKDAVSATFAREQTKEEGVVKVQWKTNKKQRDQNHQRGVGEDDETVPQLTRARMVAKPLVPSQAQAPATKAGKKNKKNAKNKKAMEPVVYELKVPPPPAPTPVPQKKQQAVGVYTKMSAAASKARDDDALEFSDPSDDDADDAARAKAFRVAKVAAPNASQTKTPTTTTTHKSVVGNTTPLVKQVVPKRPAVAPAKANGLVARSAASKSNNTRVATSGTVSYTNNATAASNSTPKPSTAKTPAFKCAQDDDDNDDSGEDKWDLDALVKKTVRQATKQSRKASMSDNDEDEDGMEHDRADADFVGKKLQQHQMHLFSQLIDEAARERWELVEVGRLVRIFAAQWGHKKKKTARFLRRYCPELVSVDFLEGLNIPLTAKQLLKIFDRGSGTSVVLMNKIASSVENGNMGVEDEDLLSFVVDQTQTMATNREIVEFLLPLLESLSKVKQVGVLLKAISEFWHLDRTAGLVQDILFTPIFDDLDGQPDVILEDLPTLEGRLDFPSCMDDEDADENGNLQGLIAGEESDLGESDEHPDDAAEEKLGEILSDDAEGEDSHAEDEVYEGETDSEEEREARERLNPTKRRRSRFVLDEADEDEEGKEEEDGFLDDDDDEDSEDSSGDSSEEEDALSKPQRKRLRQG